ncbi:MAG: hypothetical protein VKK43_00245 [Synechococcaceae cyanobacterium]|nr:hypothetical protein [Synechococcaceae cyanobacterium]
MIFKKKRFFLDLGGGEDKPAAQVAPVREAPSPEPAAGKKPAAGGVPVAEAPAPAAAPAPGGEKVLTTAEAIAAELAAAQASRPAPSQATFAPECVTAGGALPRRRRRGGADLGGFREMAKGMMGG